MGAQLAAHAANAGLAVVLLDVTADAATRGLERARAFKPGPFFVQESIAQIRTGSLDELSTLSHADWIVETVVENLEIKRGLAARIDEIRATHAVVSTNTSGLSVASIAEGRSASFRAHWLGTHFFNPPRYLHLRVGSLLRTTLAPTIEYSKRVASEIAYSTEDVDRALRWGFGWELGPLETLEPSGQPGHPSARRERRVLRARPGASLLDLGDGVLCVQFHSKMNVIGGDAIEMLVAGTREAAANFEALVIGNDADQFSAGANLMLLLLEAQEENWDEIDRMVLAFQDATQALKTCPVPVVAAPAGLTLGGGCEICLHCDRVQAAAETYFGLVETGVGLIPAGGGTKEMLLRSAGSGMELPTVFESIGFAKVSTSAADARKLGYMRDIDGLTMNRRRVLDDAKNVALAQRRGR